ncbi:MAG: hypothetical protein K1X53_01205 [Candidatus Sumerlaeaceae bacterium]|nr:hypothetical protein [Candidatus Sumerlaeaceae bacterium]
MKKQILPGFGLLLCAFSAQSQVVVIPDELTSLTARAPIVYLSESTARFEREPNTHAWISDVEHVKWDSTGETFLTNTTQPLYMTGDTIPANRKFELFPYHYYKAKYEAQLGQPLNYKLVGINRTTATLTLRIDGLGKTTDWDHYKAWEGALRGDGRTTVTLKPGERHVFWEARGLQKDLPWSGIVLGQADADLWVADYCYTSRQDPDPALEKSKPMPDLAWPPYLLASFSRGSTDWCSATIELLPHRHDEQKYLPLSALGSDAHGFAFAYSPGGPITKLAEYKVVQPTFLQDQVFVRDPVTSYSHTFFGGNYPIMYSIPMRVTNDLSATKTFCFYLASNDKWRVDSIIGVWLNGKMLWRRVPGPKSDAYWRVASVTLKPGERAAIEPIVIPLGSRWGGMLGVVQVTEAKPASAK